METIIGLRHELVLEFKLYPYTIETNSLPKGFLPCSCTERLDYSFCILCGKMALRHYLLPCLVELGAEAVQRVMLKLPVTDYVIWGKNFNWLYYPLLRMTSKLNFIQHGFDIALNI